MRRVRIVVLHICHVPSEDAWCTQKQSPPATVSAGDLQAGRYSVNQLRRLLRVCVWQTPSG